jgi:hypothetical protein
MDVELEKMWEESTWYISDTIAIFSGNAGVKQPFSLELYSASQAYYS